MNVSAFVSLVRFYMGVPYKRYISSRYVLGRIVSHLAGFILSFGGLFRYLFRRIRRR